MSRHTIKTAELLDWLPTHWTQYAASFGEQSNKTFAFSFTDQYRVTDKGVVIYAGKDMSAAVKAYNEAD